MRLIAAILFAVTLLAGSGCRPTPRSTSAELRAKHPEWPLTLNAAVTSILTDMSDADKERFRAEKKEDLIKFHHGWGTGIRNHFGLWHGNDSLMADCHADHPDDASMVIIEAVWAKLQTE